jgi:hypothetical protein
MKGAGRGHTSCRPGKKVRLKLRDGTYIFGKFKDHVGKWIYIEVDGKVKKWSDGEVFGLVIWKPQKQYDKKD